MHVFIENAGAELNLTIEYFELAATKGSRLFRSSSPKHFSAVAVLGIFTTPSNYSVTTLNMESIYEQFVPYTVQEWFMYCTKSVEREAFNALFWTIPLDTWTWVFLGISCLALTIQLRGQWFQIYSILMRQCCTVLNANKSLVIFILAAIVFTYGFEGIISSYLTVPPQFKVFKTLSELIGNGYKIIGYSHNLVSRTLQTVFERENITSYYFSYVVPNSALMDYVQRIPLFKNCSVTETGHTDELNREIRFIEHSYDIKCHIAKQTELIKEMPSRFSGNP